MNSTKVLAVVGATTGTIGALWALFLSVVYDRARVTVSVAEAWSVAANGRARRPIVWVKVRNKGRRVTHIENVSRVVSAWRNLNEMSADIAFQLTRPVRLEEGQAHSFTHGGAGGYEHG